MANRVFGELAKWTTLDDAALDWRSSAPAQRAADRERASCRRGDLFADRARNAGRAASPDHPRVLHPAAAAVSVRGQCRGALRGAGRGGRRRNCSTAPAWACCWKRRARPDGAARPLRWRWRSRRSPTQTFKDVVAEAIRKRDLVTEVDRARRERRGCGRRTVRRSSASTRTRPSSRSTRDVNGPIRRRNGRAWRSGSMAVRRSIAMPRTGFVRAAVASGEEQAKLYRRVFITEDRAHAAQAGRHRPSWAPDCATCSTPSAIGFARCSSGATPSRAATAPRRCSTIADAVISRYQAREGPARPARLRRPDRQVAQAAAERSAPPGCSTSSTRASITC